MSKKIGIYIHIPFCKKKCIYCDFISYEKKSQEIQKRYIEAIKKEIENWKFQNAKADYEIETIYIGGGTPSYIDSKGIVEILKLFSANAISQIEINPGTATKEKLTDYKNAGISRLSIGLQSADDRLLKEIGRIHTYKDFLETYMLSRNLGFKNINIDLMIGLPNQSLEDIKRTLNDVINLNPEPEHISVYSLIVEENTLMKKLIDENKLKLPREDEEREMYWYVKRFLEEYNYKHYEISNFAKPGFEAKHNIDCWEQKEYIGFGIAAHSYMNNKRFHNISNLDNYIQNIEGENFEKNIIIDEIQNKMDQMKEYILLGLRKIDGVSLKNFENKFSEDPREIFKEEFDKLYEQELIVLNNDKIKLSNKGLDFANIVWSEFV